jgi:hypothetical protein
LSSNFSIATEKEEIRTAFIQASSNKNLRESFLNRTSAFDSQSPFHKAYSGASKALMADNFFNPYSKYVHFKEGTALIDLAISLDTNNAELRYIRFLIQSKSPSFLGYNKQLEEDYTLINAAINAAKTKESWMTYFNKFLVENPALTKDL